MKLTFSIYSSRLVPVDGMIDARVVLGPELVMVWAMRGDVRALLSLDSNAAHTRPPEGGQQVVRRPK